MKQKYVPLLALLELGKGDIKIFHVEDIAIKCKKISPNSFSWKKYPENIDLRQVQRTMRSLRRDGYANGTNAEGWSLTKIGIETTIKVEFREGHLTSRRLKEFDREIIRIENSNAFSQWLEFKKVDKRNALQLLRIDEYSTISQMQAKKEKFLLTTDQISKVENRIKDFANKVISHIQTNKDEQK
jgi:hypothetical protein